LFAILRQLKIKKGQITHSKTSENMKKLGTLLNVNSSFFQKGFWTIVLDKSVF